MSTIVKEDNEVKKKQLVFYVLFWIQRVRMIYEALFNSKMRCLFGHYFLMNGKTYMTEREKTLNFSYTKQTLERSNNLAIARMSF